MPPPLEVRRDNFAKWVKRVLRQAKLARGLSIPDIAKLSGVSDPTIYRWAKGEGKDLPKPELVVMFCDALDINPIDPAGPFAILWPSKAASVEAPEPLPMDADYQLLMRKLHDPNVSDFDKQFIRETLAQLAARPTQPIRIVRRVRSNSATE